MSPQAATSFRHKLYLYYHTICYLRPIQLIYKPLYVLKFKVYEKSPLFWGKIYNRRAADASNMVRNALFLKGVHGPYPEMPDSQAIRQRAEALLTGDLTFLNHTHRFAGEIQWNTPLVSHLWRYQLHYFNYVWDIGVLYQIGGDRRFFVVFKEMVESWIEQCPTGLRDGWHPYTLSLRVVNWIYAWEFFREGFGLDPEFRKLFLQTLYKQCEFIYCNLEFQGLGNHLLANVKALVFGGIFFVGARPLQWYNKGMKLLDKELDEQVLRDGGHFERSPMYHLIVLKDLVECHMALENNDIDVPGWLKTKIAQMIDFTEALRTPDGGVPLLNDTAFDLTPDVGDTLDVARHCLGISASGTGRTFSTWGFLLTGCRRPVCESPQGPRTSKTLDTSGYFVMRGPKEFIVLDCGEVCPAYLPPHAHADTLSYELWLGNVSFITDSGVYQYESGAERDFFRSTRSHNTITVDTEDQSEVWGSFRVAKRAFPKEVCWLEKEDIVYFSGGHDGYRRLPEPVFHRRKVLYLMGHFVLILDRIEGTGVHLAESWVHFHPSVKPVNASQPLRAFARDGRALTLLPLEANVDEPLSGGTAPLQGWYSPEFGIKQPRLSVRLCRKAAAPFTLGYLLAMRTANHMACSYALESTERFVVEIDDQRWTIEANPVNLELRKQ